MEIKDLVAEAKPLLNGYYEDHGIEVAPGWYNLRNEDTGQSKTVLLHMESGFVFKHSYDRGPVLTSSGRYVGEVTFNGNHYRVRLPHFHMFPLDDRIFIQAQEYVVGEATCHCEPRFEWGRTYTVCADHKRQLSRATGCFDVHQGNWKIQDGEIVLFDFEGIRLDE